MDEQDGMSPQKKQYYVVVKGRKPGVYSKWFGAGEAAEQVQGMPDAIYKGFFTREEAINWLAEFSPEKLAPALLEFASGGPVQQVDDGDELLKMGKVVVFTDGGAINNPGPGVYGVVLKFKDQRKELSGGFRLTTNNRMEIFACIAALKSLKHKSDVVIFSDSKYVVDTMCNGWAKRWRAGGWMRNSKQKAENPDLWAQLLELCEQHTVEFRWLKGHNGARENERCDQLAVAAAQRKDLPADVAYESPKAADATLPLLKG